MVNKLTYGQYTASSVGNHCPEQKLLGCYICCMHYKFLSDRIPVLTKKKRYCYSRDDSSTLICYNFLYEVMRYSILRPIVLIVRKSYFRYVP